MARVTRREFLKASGAGALAAKTGGMAGILAASKAPAYAQATTVHWLKWADLFRLATRFCVSRCWRNREGAWLHDQPETIGLNDLQARATAAIQTGAGPDIIMIFDNEAQLYADSVADVSVVCEAIGSSQGGYYDLAKATHTTATSGLPCPIALSLPWSPIANRGSTRSVPPSSRRPGRRTGTPARSSRPRAILSGRPSVTRWVTRRHSRIPTCGHGVVARSRLTARRSTSTRKRRSSR